MKKLFAISPLPALGMSMFKDTGNSENGIAFNTHTLRKSKTNRLRMRKNLKLKHKLKAKR